MAPRRAVAAPSASLHVWSGRLFLWLGRALYVGPAADTAVHAHHATQVCVALEGPFALRAGPATPWRNYDLALIAPDRQHQLDGRSRELALLYLDPEGRESRLLAEAGPSGFLVTRPDDWEPHVLRLRECNGPRCGADEAAATVESLLAALQLVEAPGDDETDARVVTLIERMRSEPEVRLSAKEAAAIVGLSTHRFQHLFRVGTGIPFRRYLLWLRLVAAVEAVAGGATLTQAAHAAGFADSAHLSRTFRRMFGLAPSTLAKGSTFVQASAERRS